MLVPYLRDADTTNMLANYRTNINNKLDAKDTTLMLSNYLKKSEGINETDPLFKGSIAKGITAIDTSNWNRKLSVSDTVGMLDDIQNKLDTTIRNIYNKLESKIDTNLLSSGTVKGNIQYWDGQKWIVLEPGKNGQNLQLVDGSPKWNGPSFAEIVLDSITAKEETKYSFVTAWGKVAEIIEKYVTKGKEIAIEGKLTHRSYDDKDGNKRYITEVVVNDILLMGK
jgi:DNA-binding CsgD family transcriptional regulator